MRVTLALTIAAATACGPSEVQGPHVDLRVSPTPATVGTARLMVDVQDSLGVVIAGASVRLEGRPSPGVDLATLRDAVEEMPGRYVVDNFAFPNSGVWAVTVIVVTSDGLRSEVTREVRVVGGGVP